MASSIEKYIPTFSSNSFAWITYHKQLNKVFGKKETNTWWIKTWNNVGGDANKLANTNELRAYMGKHGVTVEATNIIDGISDKVENFKRIMGISLTVFSCIVLVVIASKIYGNLKSGNNGTTK